MIWCDMLCFDMICGGVLCCVFSNFMIENLRIDEYYKSGLIAY
jgi:hypothetical protein